MRLGIFSILTLFLAQTAAAQQVVQQPVVGTTSINTTVSVPDRGTTFLGGVSSAQSGRNQYGPFRSGPSSGYSRQSSSMSVTVQVHDMHAMDEAILNSAPTFPEPRRMVSGSASRKPAHEPAVVAQEESPVEKSIKFEQLARKAEEAKKTSVAKLHWQMAAKYGSKTAQERLAELAKSSESKSQRMAVR